jgi:hypothetical protein
MVKGITYILKMDAAFQGIAGRNKADTKYKAYPGVCPSPEETPYSVVRLAGKVPLAECKQVIPKEFQCTYTVFSYTKSYDDSEILDRAVVAALQRVESAVLNGVVFTDIQFKSTRDEVVQIEGGTRILFAKVSTFEATIDETLTVDTTEITADSTIVYADQE